MTVSCKPFSISFQRPKFLRLNLSKPILILFTILLTTVTVGPSYSQTRKPHSANKAALYSAILPGMGQAYNHKYWKIPVVYAGFGTFYYFINSNNKEYIKFNKAYQYKTGSNTDPGNYNEYVDKYSETSLLDGRNYYRRNRDLSIILTSFWYLLNVTDAAVDAYLFDYDVSNDLSIQIQPDILPIQGPVKPGIRVTMNLH